MADWTNMGGDWNIPRVDMQGRMWFYDNGTGGSGYRLPARPQDEERIREWRVGHRVTPRKGGRGGFFGGRRREGLAVIVISVMDAFDNLLYSCDSRTLVRVDVADPESIRLWLEDES